LLRLVGSTNDADWLDCLNFDASGTGVVLIGCLNGSHDWDNHSGMSDALVLHKSCNFDSF
jgi:hypothetical protein